MSNVILNNISTIDFTKREKIGQLFQPAAFINDTEEEIVALENLIKEHYIGSLCFFHSRASAATNFEGKKEIIRNQRLRSKGTSYSSENIFPTQDMSRGIKPADRNEDSLSTLRNLINRYQKAAKHPLLISIDAEWGLAMRIENTPQFPYAITLGALNNKPELIQKQAEEIGKHCINNGIHWNLSPVVDINNNPNNPVIGYRSFGENKEMVTQKASAFLKGAKESGVLSCVKHFPGHGDTDTDSHLGLPLINKSKEALWNNELYPFQQLINNGVEAVMVGHLSVPALSNGKQEPATISSAIIKGVLREELGFTGVVISDALNMHAISKDFPIKGSLEWTAFNAGNDILCFAENTIEGINTILEKATESQINESFNRVWKLKRKAVFKSPYVNPIEKNALSLNKEIAKHSLSLYKGNLNSFATIKENSFIGINLGNTIESSFFNEIRKTLSFKEYALETFYQQYLAKGRKNDSGNTFSSLDKSQHIKSTEHKKDNNHQIPIVLAIYPPSIKPANYFGFGSETWALLQEFLDRFPCSIYLFGNPYFLNNLNINNVENILIAYQKF